MYASDKSSASEAIESVKKQKILMIAKGTYGDMFPMYAIAKSLKKRGYELTIATNAANIDAVLSLGFHVLRIDKPDTVVLRNGFDTFLYKIAGNSWFIKTFLLSSIETEYEILLQAAEEYDLIIGNQLAYTGSMVKEKLHKPWVYCMASPMALPFSHNEPTLFPFIHGLQKLSRGSKTLQHMYVALARRVIGLFMYNYMIYRKKLGLSTHNHPTLEAMYSNRLNLLLVSPTLVNHLESNVPPTSITGFTWFEPEFFASPNLEEKIISFLNSGTAPVIFALGGDKRTNPGQYFQAFIDACKILGIRGIIVASERFHKTLSVNDSILVVSYTPYSVLFKRARALVHSGGIGTIAWCIRYKIPSLLIPTSIDQFDNANRAYRAGISDILSKRDVKAKKLANALKNLLEDRKRKENLETLSITVCAEKGEEVAVDKIEALLESIQEV